VKQITKKNHHILKTAAVLGLMSAGLLTCNAAFSESKSVAIQVSCTIKPMIEIGSSSSVNVNTNLGTKYQMTESEINRGSQRIKLHSLTAL
jgi:hypothetical protein